MASSGDSQHTRSSLLYRHFGGPRARRDVSGMGPFGQDWTGPIVSSIESITNLYVVTGWTIVRRRKQQRGGNVARLRIEKPRIIVSNTRRIFHGCMEFRPMHGAKTQRQQQQQQGLINVKKNFLYR
mmetsp:Transcript_18161/g.27688  ORF Transcript_18161/g.27688 Transcript_18161/m.27688 type:complete len:126 (+) Transcript_18161:297-674(+)